MIYPELLAFSLRVFQAVKLTINRTLPQSLKRSQKRSIQVLDWRRSISKPAKVQSHKVNRGWKFWKPKKTVRIRSQSVQRVACYTSSL
jgi:hypothetical protein